MVYIVCGDSIRELEYIKIKDQFSNIKKVDAFSSQEREELFRYLSNRSLFEVEELIAIRRSENIKDISRLVKLSEGKTLLLDYNGKPPIVKEATIIDVKDSIKSKIDYIREKLDIDRERAENILSIVGNDFRSIMNEVDKLIISKGDLSILTSSNGFELIEIAEKIIDGENINLDNIDVLSLISSLSSILSICSKLNKKYIRVYSYNNFLKIYSSLNISAHPYFVYKNIDRAKNVKDIKNRSFELLKLEHRIKLGEIDNSSGLLFVKSIFLT